MKAWLPYLAAALVIWPTEGLAATEAKLVNIEGVIGPTTANYVSRSIKEASSQRAACLIVQLDTPGGYLESTKEIVQAFSRSPVPFIVYVAPTWASATSAGCFITMAADVAAMAPHTSIGAAHPVMARDTRGEKADQVMNRKLENFAASYIEAIASKRQRNTEWAKSAVRESASITSERALELKVIEIVAKDLPDLLRQLDGREVKGRKLVTASARVEEISMSYRESIFQMLCRPEVVLILMLIAIYGIIGELSNPGAILPGVAGGIALVLALYLAAILPINFAGLALIGLALVLFTVDVFAPTHGVLTVGGTLSFFLGAWMLFDPSEPAFQLSLSFILPATLLTAAFFLFAVGKGLRAQSLPVRVGKEAMLGSLGKGSISMRSSWQNGSASCSSQSACASG